MVTPAILTNTITTARLTGKKAVDGTRHLGVNSKIGMTAPEELQWMHAVRVVAVQVLWEPLSDMHHLIEV